MLDAIIIGAGPAGISASLYLKRGNKDVLVLYHGESQLEKAHKIDNFYGFPNGISGKDLYNNGINQARNLGIDVIDSEVIDIKIDNNIFTVKTIDKDYQARSIVIATGNKKIKPNIQNLDKYEGLGVSYCAICDGFFYRKKKVCVIGNDNYALAEANDLKNVTDDITILTNGLELKKETDFKVDTRKIKSLGGNEVLEYVEFEDGTRLETRGVFIALGVAGGVDFAKKLGILVNGENIKTDENMKTNIDGIYATGNISGGLLQINKACYEGAKAAIDIIKYLNNDK